MEDLKQCPYDKATECKMDEPCEGCETWAQAKGGMMDIEDKKFLVEWMGWQTFADYYTPDSDPFHFAEVWKKLTPGQQQLVLENCETMDTAEIISALLSKEGLAEFCGFVLEVLKETPKSHP